MQYVLKVPDVVEDEYYDEIADILELVLMECARQRLKFGIQEDRTPLRWVSIETEELGEVAQLTNDALEGKETHLYEVLTEWVQVAAVAVTAIRSIARFTLEERTDE
jgi:hypothetical protein